MATAVSRKALSRGTRASTISGPTIVIPSKLAKPLAGLNSETVDRAKRQRTTASAAANAIAYGARLYLSVTIIGVRLKDVGLEALRGVEVRFRHTTSKNLRFTRSYDLK
jgi:hypothetical protein